MNRLVLALLLGLSVMLVGCDAGGKNLRTSADSMPADVGVASMLPNGTIVLRLRSVERGRILEGYKEYKPGDSEYEGIRSHLGGIEPGQNKPIPPWPDSKKK